MFEPSPSGKCRSSENLPSVSERKKHRQGSSCPKHAVCREATGRYLVASEASIHCVREVGSLGEQTGTNFTLQAPRETKYSRRREDT